VGQERLVPSYFFIPLVLGPLNSLVWYVPSLRYTRGLGWRMHCGLEVTESSTNKQHHLSTPRVYGVRLFFVSVRTNKRQQQHKESVLRVTAKAEKRHQGRGMGQEQEDVGDEDVSSCAAYAMMES
jgi:hypothetical protein